jgi:hypothetical protein
MSLEFILDRLGNLSDIVGLGTFSLSVLIYLRVQNETRRIRRSLAKLSHSEDLGLLIQEGEPVRTVKPVALAFSLTPTVDSLKPAVEEFLRGKELKMPIEEVNRQGLSAKTIQDFYEAVKQKKLELDMKGYTEVHLFFSGPVQAGVIVGCLFSNWKLVKLYHKGPVTYEYWMPLVKS